MNKKTLVILALPFILLQVVRFAGGERGGLLTILAFLAFTAIQFEYYKRRWRKRMKRLREAKPIEIAEALKRMDPRERSAARLYLGISSSEPNRIGADEVLFYYRRPT